jgi:hypothetical protein
MAKIKEFKLRGSATEATEEFARQLGFASSADLDGMKVMISSTPPIRCKDPYSNRIAFFDPYNPNVQRAIREGELIRVDQ